MTSVHEADLERAGELHAAAKQDRTFAHQQLAKAVRAAHRANMPQVEIARLAGVSRQTVHNILNR